MFMPGVLPGHGGGGITLPEIKVRHGYLVNFHRTPGINLTNFFSFILFIRVSLCCRNIDTFSSFET